MSGPFTQEESAERSRVEAEKYWGTGYGSLEAAVAESNKRTDMARQQTIDTNPFIAEFVNQGLLSMDEVPLYQPSPYAISIDNMTKPMPDELINIFRGGGR
jgi:hypothetical protein